MAEAQGISPTTEVLAVSVCDALSVVGSNRLLLKDPKVLAAADEKAKRSHLPPALRDWMTAVEETVDLQTRKLDSPQNQVEALQGNVLPQLREMVLQQQRGRDRPQVGSASS